MHSCLYPCFGKRDGFTAKSNKLREKVPDKVDNRVLFDRFMPHVVLPFKIKKKDDRHISFVVRFNDRKHTERDPIAHLEHGY